MAPLHRAALLAAMLGDVDGQTKAVGQLLRSRRNHIPPSGHHLSCPRRESDLQIWPEPPAHPMLSISKPATAMRVSSPFRGFWPWIRQPSLCARAGALRTGIFLWNLKTRKRSHRMKIWEICQDLVGLRPFHLPTHRNLKSRLAAGSFRDWLLL